MPSVQTTVPVAAPVEVVYRYLSERYGRPAYLKTSLATRGYVPKLERLVADEPSYLGFRAKGRDPILRISYGGWEWEYHIQAAGDQASEVTIGYRWSWGMSIMCAGTIRAQACNAIVYTAMALDALGWHGAAGPQA
jgi:hypothetical protein